LAQRKFQFHSGKLKTSLS